MFCDKSFQLGFEGRKCALKLPFVSLEVPCCLLSNLADLQTISENTIAGFINVCYHLFVALKFEHVFKIVKAEEVN